jgi:hypothetical protein
MSPSEQAPVLGVEALETRAVPANFPPVYAFSGEVTGFLSPGLDEAKRLHSPPPAAGLFQHPPGFTETRATAAAVLSDADGFGRFFPLAHNYEVMTGFGGGE